jgi:hypothetical protein
MTVKSKAGWLPLKSLAFGSIGAAYAAVGTALQNPVNVVTITNTTDVQLLISTDGVNDHIVVPSQSWAVRDISAMRTATSEDSTIKAGTQFYAKGTPTVGSVYIEALYIS